MSLIKPAKFIKDDYCTKCNNNSIEVYNFFGRPLNFSTLVDYRLATNQLDYTYDKNQVCYMKCKSCGQRYYIDWTDGFPRPMREQNFLLKKFQMLFIDEEENKNNVY